MVSINLSREVHTCIDRVWDIDLSNIPVSDRAIISKNLRKETIEALNRIAQVAE